MSKPALEEKELLTQEEAIQFFQLSRRRWNKFIRDGPKKTFIVMYKNRRFIMREALLQFFKDNPAVKERLVNGR